MYRSISSLISARRQRQSDLVEIRVPSSLRKGSGSRELDVNETVPGTGQPALSSSTAAAAGALVAIVTTVTAPAAASAAAASATTVERILERPELMLTGALLPGRADPSASTPERAAPRGCPPCDPPSTP